MYQSPNQLLPLRRTARRRTNSNMAAASPSVRDRVLELLASHPDGLTDGLLFNITLVSLIHPSKSALSLPRRHSSAMLTEAFGSDAMGRSVLPVLNSMMQANRLSSMMLESGGIIFRLVDEQVSWADSIR